MSWVIREFNENDEAGCLAVMQSNMPTYFADYELAEFQLDLENRARLAKRKCWPYFVLVTNGRIRACGGYEVDRRSNAHLLWGMVDRNEHRSGLGSLLLEHRLRQMRQRQVAKQVLLDTTPASFGFYRKAGFVQTGFEKDGYAPGLDKILASKPL